jgi:hypothetical protein
LANEGNAYNASNRTSTVRREIESLEERLTDAYESDLSHALIFRNISLVLIAVFFLISCLQIVRSIGEAFIEFSAIQDYNDMMNTALLVASVSSFILISVTLITVYFIIRLYMSFSTAYDETIRIISEPARLEGKKQQESGVL